MFNYVQSKKKSTIKNLIKSKITKYTQHKKNKNKDDFMIRFAATHSNPINKNQLTDHRRLVFVSLIGLYQTYQNCTPMELYSALIIVPLKRSWIYNQNKYEQEYKTTFLSTISIFQDTAKNEEFIELLKWKDQQNLVFWMLDNYTNNNPHIAPFWQHLSDILINLYNPVTGNKYKPIQFNDKLWNELKPHQFKFTKGDNKVKNILNELSFLTMKYDEICEIIYQSNPKSFRPITMWNNSDRRNFSENTDNKNDAHLYEKNEPLYVDQICLHVLNDSNWVMLDTYDAYDIDNDILSN